VEGKGRIEIGERKGDEPDLQPPPLSKILNPTRTSAAVKIISVQANDPVVNLLL